MDNCYDILWDISSWKVGYQIYVDNQRINYHNRDDIASTNAQKRIKK